MTVIKKGEVPFQTYARIISILGDQLITDKWVGVIELVKNCYDADAENVAVRFMNFDNPSENAPATIEIEDDGEGMTLDTILNVWMKPATPNKLNRKKTKEKRYTNKGRVMLGDKGVGRFAVYKLGDFVELYTKSVGTEEVKLTLDFSEYADEEGSKTVYRDKYLEDILNKYEVFNQPTTIMNKKNQGTLIRITDVRNNWKRHDLDKLLKAFKRMQPPSLPGLDVKKDFSVNLFWDSVKYIDTGFSVEELLELAPFYFEGFVDKDGNLEAIYKHNTIVTDIKFNLFDDQELMSKYDIKKMKLYKESFVTNKDTIRKPDIGSFIFFIYAFDLESPDLKKDEKELIKDTSVYLYRDNVRVYPYGELGDDWLKLSKSRAEDRAGYYFSYRDLIGFVFITQQDNPKLRDAADREGLMNVDGAYDDFVALINTVLKIMKDKVAVDKNKYRMKREKLMLSAKDQFKITYDKFCKKISSIEDKDLLEKSKKLYDATNKFVESILEKMKITQELAGLGMAVEKSTHDTLVLIKQLVSNTEDIVRKLKENRITSEELKEFMLDIIESLKFLYQELQTLQPILRVARKVTKDVDVTEMVRRVARYYEREITRYSIDVKEPEDSIIVKTNTGLILQVLLNLMDNAVYWMSDKSVSIKQITISIDAEKKELIFADTGPGIDEDIADIVFTEFFTKKADGRGLGLYIVRELLDRIDAQIMVVTNEREKILSGANFKIKFKE